MKDIAVAIAFIALIVMMLLGGMSRVNTVADRVSALEQRVVLLEAEASKQPTFRLP